MSMTNVTPSADTVDPREDGYPFHITKEEERQLRLQGARAVPSLVIGQATSFDEYARQLMIPPAVMDLARKAEDLRLSAWEVEAMRKHLAPAEPDGSMGLLRRILVEQAHDDRSHPPYIRVACTGRGNYDHLATEHGHLDLPRPHPEGDIGSPVVLEIWPAQHYSPIHSHGHTTGIVFCLAGQLDVMVYEQPGLERHQARPAHPHPGAVRLAHQGHLRRAPGVLPDERRRRHHRPGLHELHRRVRRQLPRLPQPGRDRRRRTTTAKATPATPSTTSAKTPSQEVPDPLRPVLERAAPRAGQHPADLIRRTA